MTPTSRSSLLVRVDILPLWWVGYTWWMSLESHWRSRILALGISAHVRWRRLALGISALWVSLMLLTAGIAGWRRIAASA